MRRFLSLGAGVQSSTLALMLSKGPVAGHAPPEIAFFSDTGNEPPRVYEWLDWLEPRLSFPVRRVGRPPLKMDLRSDSVAIRTAGPKAKYPGRRYLRFLVPYYKLGVKHGRDLFGDFVIERKGRLTRRGCTADFKIKPLTVAQRAEAKIPRGCKEVMVTRYIGFSIDEYERLKSPREPWAVHAYPLVDAGMTRADCLSWMKAEGFPEPPRSACYFCPFHSNREWQKLKTDDPASFAKAVEYERDLNTANESLGHSLAFLHVARKPLVQIDFTKEKDPPGMAQGCSPYGCPNGGAKTGGKV